MPDKPARYTITAALPYANGPVHIGHLAGVYVPADIYVRYLRSNGKDVAFICGSDEHGVPITIRAKNEGVSPKEVTEKYHQLIKSSFDRLGISFSIYSRTSSETHYETASKIFKNMYTKGMFEEKEAEQFYDPKAEQFLADRYIKGTCPNCKYADAYGDQCESCGTTLSPSDLIAPKSMLSGAEPILKKTKHWYLPMNEYEPWLKEWIIEGHKEWKNNVYGQCKSWIDSGLQARAMTRDLDWGIPVPLPDAEGKVLYVWFDAPIGYISATKDWAVKEGIDWEPYWKDDNSKLVHFIGKDNIVFHCIIFPIILKAHGDFILPENVPANEFLNLEGQKISTSRNWAVWLHEYLEEFPDKEDVLRYVLCANAPETKDNDFTWKDFQARNNNELVAILGNFVNRALVLTQKFYNGRVPARNELFKIDESVISELAAFPNKISDSIEQYRFREALSVLMDLARLGNKYLADTEPWKLIKTNEDRVQTIMNISLQIVANLAVLAEPFLPFTAGKMNAMLGIEKTFSWKEAGSISLLEAGSIINEPSLLFNKVEDEVVEKQINRLLETKKENEMANQSVPEAKAEISFDDFQKMDIRIGTITDAQNVKKSKKLLKLTVEAGLDTRTIVSGIAEHYTPESVVGSRICFLANLAPRNIMGIESKGMILMAEDKDGKLAFLQPDKAVWNGGTVS